MTSSWMLYGAYGYTGKLITAEAVKYGHKPILAGRNATKLEALAQKYDLPHIVIDLDDKETLEAELAKVDLVMHSAGPYTFTASPMRNACLATGTHYLDLSGEITILEEGFTFDALAKERGICMISGAGYDVVPTDCLSAYIKTQLPDATHLVEGLAAGGGMGASAGTMKSLLELLKDGNYVRRNGKLTSVPLGSGVQKIPFRDKEYLALIIPWGDLATAYRTTGIPNMTTYFVLPTYLTRMAQIGGPLVPVLFQPKFMRRTVQYLIDLIRKDREANMSNADGKTMVYMKASNSAGESREVWLETPEAYIFTARVAIPIIEKVLAENPSGAFSPAQLLGPDFIFGLEGIVLHDD